MTQARCVKRDARTIEQHMQYGVVADQCFLLRCAFLRTAFAVQHIGACHFVVTATHETEFDLVLHIFNMEGAATRA